MTFLWIAAPVSLAIVLAARRVDAITRSGAAAAFVVGIACLGGGGLRVGLPLFGFFVTGSALSRMRARSPRPPDDIAHKGASRDAVQVLANGGVAAVCAAIAGVASASAMGAATVWLTAAVCAIAVAAADTWATEIGIRSHGVTRSIVSGKTVPPGTSGGVTPIGCVASLAGGGAIGLLAALSGAVEHYASWVAVCGGIGGLGAALDSVLGATVQGAWRCDTCEVACEAPVHRCGSRARIVRGVRWLDNDGVNALSTTAGAALGCLASRLLG